MKKIILSSVLLISCLTLSANALVVKKNASDITPMKQNADITKKEAQSVEFLTNVASEINKTLPMMVDKITRLNNVQAFKAKLAYNYTIKKVDELHITAHKIVAILKPISIQSICSNPDTQVFPDNDIDIEFNYFKENGQFITKFRVTSQDCKNLKK